MPMAETTMNTATLTERWAAYRAEYPRARIRNAADDLGVSEAALLATGVGKTCTRLQADFVGVLTGLPALGKVMALTRSDGAVHEVSGVFGQHKTRGETLIYLRPGQDTRYFLGRWHYAFAVNENERLSLQFFDRGGDAIHKIFLLEASDAGAYQELVARYRLPEQVAELDEVTDQSSVNSPAPPAIDADALRQRWTAIQDVHEGSRIIRDYGRGAPAVYRALGDKYAQLLPADSVETLLGVLAEHQQACMIFGMNNNAVQSYAGLLTKLLRTGPWFNVLDPDFNLHLRTDLIGEVWQVMKPSGDGEVHAINVFDQKGEEMLILTDQRGRGQPESSGWREALKV